MMGRFQRDVVDKSPGSEDCRIKAGKDQNAGCGNIVCGGSKTGNSGRSGADL